MASNRPYDPDRAHDVNAALSRAKQHWTTKTTATACEGAFLDRTLLASEVLRLRAELAETIDSLAESDMEIMEIRHMLSAADLDQRDAHGREAEASHR